MESSLRAGAGSAGLRLIETLLWDGATFPRLSLHLDRLTRSAAMLGWTADRPATAAALLAAVHAGQPARLRLTLDGKGALQVEIAALPQGKPLWVLGLARTRLSSTDPWLRIKSSNRAAYDRARAALPDGIDEVVFANEKDEVCDGSITTLFFDRGAGLCTPPLTSGLLPGVLRAQMAVPEQRLLVHELPHVRLWVGNALRGLIPAIWQG